MFSRKSIHKKLNQQDLVDTRFSLKGISGLTLLILILCFLPHFFRKIENRPGTCLDDWLLAKLPIYNVSIPIFLIVWGLGLLLLIRSVKNPVIFVQYIWAYCFICITRMISISLVPLAPPHGFIALTDPLTGIFYGRHAVTKDLFYSGHTATALIIALCLKRSNDRKAAFLLVAALISLLLIQHIHYTIDIIAAFPFSYLVYKFTVTYIVPDERCNDLIDHPFEPN